MQKRGLKLKGQKSKLNNLLYADGACRSHTSVYLMLALRLKVCKCVYFFYANQNIELMARS